MAHSRKAGKRLGPIYAMLRRDFLLGIPVATVAATAVTIAGGTAGLAAAVGVLALIASVGWRLWTHDPDRQKALGGLGAGLLVGVLVASAVGVAQFALNQRLTEIEKERQRTQQRETLRFTLGLQPSFNGIDLRDTDLHEFYIRRKGLREANLRGADLTRASLQRSDLYDATLRGANLTDARLIGANLCGANMGRGPGDGKPANLTGADLFRANLRRSTVRGTDFSHAHLQNANMKAKGLDKARLTGAIYDSHTKWPHGFHPRAAGAKRVKDRGAEDDEKEERLRRKDCRRP